MKILKMSLLFCIAFCTICTAGTPLHSEGHSYIMKLIPLSQGKFAQVDDSDYEWLMNWKWCAVKGYGNYYSQRGIYLGVIDGKKTSTPLKMHRAIMKPEKGFVVDHIDGDGLNNQRANLRVCLPRENTANRKPSKNGTSKYLGVMWCPSRNNWRVRITSNKKKVHVGEFRSEEDAALAYNRKAIELHGEFARLNVIPENHITEKRKEFGI